MKVRNLFRLSGSAALGLMLLAANSNAAIVQRDLNFNQVYQGRNYISLRELVFSGGRFPQQGGRLLSLEITAMARGRFASGMLMINGQANPYGRFQMGRGQNNYRIDVNRFIGQDIQDIGLELDGMVYLQQVRAIIDEPMGGGFPGHHPGGPGQPGGGVERFQQPLTQWYYSGQTFHLRQLLNLGPQLNGRVVEYVEFAGRTQQGTAQATVMINGIAAGQSVILDGFDRVFRIPINRLMGQDIQTLQIQFVGANVYIDFMAVAMRGGMQQPQPYPQPYPGQPGQPGAGPAPGPGTGPGPGAGPGAGGPGRPGPRFNSDESSESSESEE